MKFSNRNFIIIALLHLVLPHDKHQTIFLNPILTGDTLYDDFNDTYDYPNTYYDNYDYGTSNNGDELYTTSSYKEKDILITDSNLTHYDASSTIIAKFLTDSTTAENLYTSSSTSSQSETAPSTIIEQNTIEGVLFFFLNLCQIRIS